jgi:type IV pilus assembly protein PilX
MSQQNHSRRPGHIADRGFVMVTGLLFLVVLTLLCLALFRSTGIMDRISSNTRDKQRSFEMAQAALRYGEWYMGNNPPNIATCASNNYPSATASLHVCQEALPASAATVAALGWQSQAYAYTPSSSVSVSTNGGVNSATGDFNYYQAPGVYIEQIGTTADGTNTLYQITAYGYGGSADAVSVVRSVVKVSNNSTCMSCSP